MMRTSSLNQVQVTFTFAVVLLFLNSIFCEIEVRTSKGILKGQILKSRDGRPYYSFTGIPYAKPPVGELRFEAPKPVEPWEGVLDATKRPKLCAQKVFFSSGEDCLYLNVYTPSTKGDFPVMFWIHGGAFSTGHGSPQIYGPEYFMDKNVVLVTMNYRLGALGFLSAEDDVIPGNYGMKDQVMALRWVRENVGKFGGDPGAVTIFGESSGGACVGYHMLSPMSKGLFHKAIIQSGSPMCRWSASVPGVARNRSKTIAQMAGCSGNTSEDTLKCLKTLPTRFFVEAYEKFYEWRTYPTILFSPVAETCDSGEEAFLCQNQLYAFEQQSFVPAIVGLNSAEGAMVVSSLYNDTSLQYPEFRTDFNRLISILLSYQYFASDVDAIGEKVFNRYFPTGKIEDHSHPNAVKMITDGRYLHGVFDMALKLSSPVYFYLYDYQNEFSLNTRYGKCNKKLGVTHGDELTSFFKSVISKPRELNAMDTMVSKRMVDIWSKFAASKTPTIDGTENGIAWPKFDSQKQKILYINSDRPTVVKNPLEENYSFWNKLPLLSNLNKVINENEGSSCPGFKKNDL